MLLVTGGITLLGANIIENIVTGGAGIADDPVVVPAGVGMVATGLGVAPGLGLQAPPPSDGL